MLGSNPAVLGSSDLCGLTRKVEIMGLRNAFVYQHLFACQGKSIITHWALTFSGGG